MTASIRAYNADLAIESATHRRELMPRTKRYFLPGHVWHITHRCHKQELLLKFQRDRPAWRYWLY